mmetsp:Transcript_16204/g.26703  ORF Transcript_16204/g.26703 Transcript_16204/m.26703 type:complete len:310 (+) Transcript_16204:200-1129(+)
MSCCATVSTSEVGIVERFSRFVRLANPGLTCICPCIESVRHVSLRIRQLLVAVETKTKDNVFVKMEIAVQFQVSDPFKAYYTLQYPEDQIRAHVCDVVRGSVPKVSLDGVFEVKDEIAHAVKESLSRSLADSGYSVMSTLVTDIEPDAEVKRSMNSINAAQRLRLAAVEKGEADKILQVKAAEADAERKYLDGAGVARQRKAIMDGLGEAVTTFMESVPNADSKTVLDLMVIMQHFDVMREVGSHGRSSIFIPYGPGAVSSLAEQVRNGILSADMVTTTTVQPVAPTTSSTTTVMARPANSIPHALQGF